MKQHWADGIGDRIGMALVIMVIVVIMIVAWSVWTP